MNASHHFRGRRAAWAPWLLAVLFFSLAPAFTPAAAPGAESVVTTRSAVLPETVRTPVLLALPQILGDQKAMIQVGVVIAAIGIFWLTRSIK